MHRALLSLAVILLLYPTSGHDFKGFDDTVLYDIQWPGVQEADKMDLAQSESMIVTTSHLEKYKCLLPEVRETETDVRSDYTGPTALQLIEPLLAQEACSFRIETYWTYEVCHGKNIRQYHENRESGKGQLKQEYLLGKWDDGNHAAFLREAEDIAKDKSAHIPVKKIDNVNLPYVEILMGNGTLCALNNNRPRETRVQYVCYVHGKHEVYSLKEISTCVYEIIILTPLLCDHPRYKPKQMGENKINCIPLENSPNRPYNLMKMQLEHRPVRQPNYIEIIPLEYNPIIPSEDNAVPEFDVKPPMDLSPVEKFLSGKECLIGGTGFWRYEFCYGRYLNQFHQERDGRRIVNRLGTFIRAKHLDWVDKNVLKRPGPKGSRKRVSQFYSEGSMCDKTGRARQTEVQLKCAKNEKSTALSLALEEPRPCEYIMSIESSLICHVLDRADEMGLIDIEGEENAPNTTL